MNSLETELTARLEALRQQGLHRELRRVDSAQRPQIRIGDRSFSNFSSNDYLGLADHPSLKEAAIRAIERYGAGAGASRLVCGSLAPHADLDVAIAGFKGTAAALSFSTGYAAALGTIGAVMSKGDTIILDKLVHACIVDAARLSGAAIRVFPHNDLNRLEELLKWADSREPASIPGGAAVRGRTLVVTESVFSMDGDQAPLREIVGLKDRYGAWLMVDEAHATGLFGEHRRGLAEGLGVSDRIEIQMGTLGKAMGAAGGYICGSRPLIDYLVNRARSFIFSTAPVPAAAAAATAAIRLVQSPLGEDLCRELWRRVEEAGAVLGPPGSGTEAGPAPAVPRTSAILPLIIGGEEAAVAAATALRARNLFVPAIRYPTVARGRARLRLTLTAAHTREQVAEMVAAMRELGLPPSPAPNHAPPR